MSAPARAYVGLGANLGDARATLNQALQALARLPDTRCVAGSSFYRSAPVGAQGPDYLNAVVALDTGLGPHALLHELQRIETEHGRQRPFPNAPRTLDLDLLLHGEGGLDDAVLTLPHPRGHLRAFVLLPLAEIAPGLVWPGQGSVEQLAAGLHDQRIERLPP